MSSVAQHDGIAVVGVGALLPGAASVGEFWRNVLSGRELMRDVPGNYWLAEDFYDPDPRKVDKVYCKRGAFLDEVDFDPMKYGVPPKLLTSTDSCQLLALMVADQVLHDAFGNRFEKVDRDRIGVVLGVCSGLELVGEMAGRLQRPGWVKVMREHGLPEEQVQSICEGFSAIHPDWTEATFPGLLNNVVSGRVANKFDLGGPNFTTDAACASSLAALAMAANMLRQGDADLVVTGGADTTNDPFTFMCFSKTPALSLSSQCRPFSESADGTMLGEGLAMLAVKRLSDAERDGDRIYAVVRGCGSSSDGRATSIYAPRWEGQVKALERCYARAGYGPQAVDLVEAHGTGTQAGDLAEFRALTEVFDASGREDRQWCALGSIKSQLGHTKATAGAVGLVKTVLALHQKVLPPTLGVDKPGAKLEIEKTPFYLNTVSRPWVAGSERPRRASVSSFGFGGTNFHITVEEYGGSRDRTRRVRALPTELVVLSEASRASLVSSARELAAAASHPGALAHIAHETQSRFRAEAPARLAVIATDVDQLRARLTQAADSIARDSTRVLTVPGSIYFSDEPVDGGVAFVFPGQGSQYVGMGADLAMEFDAARAVWDAEAGRTNLHDVVFPRPAFTDADRDEQSTRLRATEWAQPAIGAMSVSMLALLRLVGLKADCVAGHSFGELSALYAAGSLDRESFLRLARHRGELMARAAESSAGSSGMIAVTASLDQVEGLLADCGAVVANHNDPRQVVVSGTIDAIEEVERRIAAAGLKAQRLPVAAAFHSPVVALSVQPFARILADVEFKPPSLPVMANATAQPYPDGPAAIREQLSSSIARRVRFLENVEAMYARGVRTFVEVGPGTALTGMIARICSDRRFRAIALDRPGAHGVTSLWQGLAQVAVAGHPLDFSALWTEFELGPDPRAQPKPKLTMRIGGTNYGKRYPPEGGAAALPRPNTGEVMETKDKKAAGERAELAPAARASAPDGNGAGTNGATMPRPPAIGKSSLANGANGNGAASHHTNGTTPVSVDAAPLGAEIEDAASPGLVVSHEYVPAMRQSDVSAWLVAYDAIQCRTAEAHTAYQQAMAECHLAFLHAAEQSALALASLATGAPLAMLEQRAPQWMTPKAPARPQVAAAPGLSTVSRAVVAPAPQAAPQVKRLDALVQRAPIVVPPSATSTSPSQVSVSVRPATAPGADGRQPAPAHGANVTHARQAAVVPPTPSALPTPAMPPATPAASPALPAALAPLVALKPKGGLALPADGDLKSFLFNIVADKTGYPVDVLNLDQQLEADLGIDSIKRVEILSAFEGQIENIQDINLEEVAKLNTLRDVLGFMERFADKLGLEVEKKN
jgi:acyl transferase domain-containing protein